MGRESGEVRTPEREGAMFLIYKNGKVLLEKRTSLGKAYFGYTTIPAGKVEKDNGEIAIDAAKREMEEECGVIAKKLIPLDTFLHVTMSNTLYHTTAFLVTDYEGEVKNVEGKSEQTWVDIDKADEILPFAESRYVIKLAREYLLRQN